MATRVELDRTRTVQALEMLQASNKRQHNTTKNPQFKPILEKEMADLQNAINTITEIK